MKYVKTYQDYAVSEGFRYHMENGLDITNSVYRIGSDAYKQLFEETKKYWDEGNVILSAKAVACDFSVASEMRIFFCLI